MTFREEDRPRAGAAFYKAHGLGNDYLVFEEGDAWRLEPGAVGRVCDRWRGAGGDGIVLLLADGGGEDVFRLRMFNPDGSEFERSGNGLRILASFLARGGRARIGSHPFTVLVGGDHVTLTVHARAGAIWDVSVAMGRARTGPEAVELDPGALDPGGRLRGPRGEPLDVTPVSVGNPHLVVFVADPTDGELRRLGPFLATHPALSHGANVQLASVTEAGTCRALIWERGVGHTSASGTSSCAVAVAAVSRGLLPPGRVVVEMEGGELEVTVTSDLDVTLRGPVEEVCVGNLTEAFLEALAG